MKTAEDMHAVATAKKAELDEIRLKFLNEAVERFMLKAETAIEKVASDGEFQVWVSMDAIENEADTLIIDRLAIYGYDAKAITRKGLRGISVLW